MGTPTIEDFKEELNKRISFCERALETWGEKFAQDPSHALQWGSDQAFRHAANLEVCKSVLGRINNGTSGSIASYLNSEVVYNAKHAEQYDSVPFGLYKRNRLSIFAELLVICHDMGL